MIAGVTGVALRQIENAPILSSGDATAISLLFYRINARHQAPFGHIVTNSADRHPGDQFAA